jgi:ribonuclease D
VPVAWIDTPEALAALVRDLQRAGSVAVDTEADSLHHYPERLCLIQFADPAGRVCLVDPLALPDLDPLQALFADPATRKIFHSGENDVAQLKRRHDFTFAGLADTMFAARFLGVRELGLERLLTKFLGVQPVKSQQKTDWARRPLTADQVAYASEDVTHLHALLDHLVAELRLVGRDAWLAEECEALASLVPPVRVPDDEAYRKVRGATQLDRSGLAVLRSLWQAREAWARAEHRPPFKVLSPETLVALALRQPADREGLAGVPGLPPRLIERYGDGVLEAVARGRATPLPEPPRVRRPRPPGPSPDALRRGDALKRWRAAAAEQSGLDPGILLPQRLIDLLAEAPPATTKALAAVPGFRRWRAAAFGAEVLAALQAPPAA